MTLGYNFLKELLDRKGQTETSLAQNLSLTPQAVNSWKTSNRIPTKRVSQIAELYNLVTSEIDRLLGVEPLKVEYRTKRGDHLAEIEVSEHNKVRSQILFERLFEGQECKLKYDFGSLRSAIRKVENNFHEIAKLIRNEFTLPDYRPLTHEDSRALLHHVGVRALYLPFGQIGLNPKRESGGQDQTAILFQRDDSYALLFDSDRTIDEAHFDRAHEFIHIVFGDIFVQSNRLEELIDKVAGELIYPRRFIIERFFNGDESSRLIRDRELLRKRFYEVNAECRFILSPHGLARAMKDAELTSRNSELYDFLSTTLHAEFRNVSHTYTKFGKMDFVFSDRASLSNFYSKMVDNPECAGLYPLFSKLKEDVLSGALPASDFADTFGLDYSDALVLLASWEPTQR